MADFCKQCSIDVFQEDFGDMKGVTKVEHWEVGLANQVLCEGCGIIQVNPEGSCVSSNCIKKHNTVEEAKEIWHPALAEKPVK